MGMEEQIFVWQAQEEARQRKAILRGFVAGAGIAMKLVRERLQSGQECLEFAMEKERALAEVAAGLQPCEVQ